MKGARTEQRKTRQGTRRMENGERSRGTTTYSLLRAIIGLGMTGGCTAVTRRQEEASTPWSSSPCGRFGTKGTGLIEFSIGIGRPHSSLWIAVDLPEQLRHTTDQTKNINRLARWLGLGQVNRMRACQQETMRRCLIPDAVHTRTTLQKLAPPINYSSNSSSRTCYTGTIVH